jgi:hypothetical protein
MKSITSESGRFIATERRWGGDIEIAEMVNGQKIRRCKSIDPRTIPAALNAGQFLGELELSFLLLSVWREKVSNPTVQDGLLALRWLVVTLFIIQQVIKYGRPVCVADGTEYEIDFFALNDGMTWFITAQGIEERGLSFGWLYATGWISGMIDSDYFVGKPGKYLTEQGAEIMSGMVKQLYLMRESAQ